MQSTELSYRSCAAQGAGGFGWLIALYDTLAGNLRRAAAAERTDNLEQRCIEVNHALLVIGYLEDCVERAGGGELAALLASLYSSLRRNLMEAQVKRSPQILEQQMERVLSIRERWHTMGHAVPDAQDSVADLLAQDVHVPAYQPAEPQIASWSA